ncbi:hypothetical protein NQD34_006640 [Periophthalmus magnuspinnatus]|nr:hypothetical protein NQD34_006640 [Periophthalmus magnuspinnatus]
MLLLLSSSEFSRCSLSSYPPPERRCWGHDWLLSATSLRGSPAGPRRVLGAVTGMRAAVLGLSALVWSALVVLSCGLTGPAPCPRALDCARLGRHFCRPGTSHCGPCLQPLVQNSRGRCVFNKRRAHHATNPTALTTPSHRGTVSFPELDEQIDMLSAIITEQRSKVMLTAPPPPTVPALSAPPTEMPTNHSASSSASPQRHPQPLPQR